MQSTCNILIIMEALLADDSTAHDMQQKDASAKLKKGSSFVLYREFIKGLFRDNLLYVSILDDTTN